MFTICEQVSTKTKNIKIHLIVVKIIDIVMSERWFSLAKQDTWTLIYLVNYIFDLHDVFVGSMISQRLVQSAKRILLDILEHRHDKLNQEQSCEINSLLNTDAIKGSKSYIQFESDTKELRALLESPLLEEKTKGIKDLMTVFGHCYNLADQLLLFSNKC